MAPERRCGAWSGPASARESEESTAGKWGTSGGRFLESAVRLLGVKTVSWPRVRRGKMKLSRQFTVFGSAIFCVVIFSLYLMLDRGHLDYPKGQRREGSFPQVSTGVLTSRW